MTLSDRIAVFNNGYVEQVGTPYEIYNKSQSEFVCDFIGDINKLGENILNEINRLANSDLNVKKSGFIRIEQCLSENKGDQVKLVGTVSEVEFNGVLTKYTLECLGETIKYLEKNDGYKLYGEGDQIEIYINPKDIMQF